MMFETLKHNYLHEQTIPPDDTEPGATLVIVHISHFQTDVGIGLIII